MTAICEPEEAIGSEPDQAILKTQHAMPIKPLTPPIRIVLTGFMGAGKSTVGRLLAGRLGWRFLDMDEEVVNKAAMPVADIFAKYGEFVFRRMETSAIAHALGEREAVIALGGGAVEVLANRLLLEQTPRTTVAFLDASLEVLLGRCSAQTEGAERPNLHLAEERFRYRAPLYRRVSRVRLLTSAQTAEQTVAALLQQLGMDGGDVI